MNWCILIPVFVGLLCGILGYLLGKLLRQGSKDIEEWKRKNAQLSADLEACKNKLSAKGPSAASTSSSIASSFASASVTFDADMANAIFDRRIKENDLTIIEGIGPKIQELFHSHDIRTWRDLADCSVNECQKVLDSGGGRYKIHNPRTWPQQAGLAANGKWEELKNWQEELDGGK